MKKYKITITQEVTQEQIDDIMAGALHTAISYWCSEVRYKRRPKEEVKYTSDALTRGGVLELRDDEEEKWVTLSLTKLLKALSGKPFNFDDYDNLDVDDLIQRAVFGEVIYG